MIEVIYEKEKEKAEGNQVFFRIPNNIRQIGEIQGNQKIYIEDYAYTYLCRIASEDSAKGRAAILLGQANWKDTRGGTILGTSRQPFKLMRVPDKDGLDKVEAMKHTYHKLNLNCLIILGGNGTHKTANLLREEGLNVITLPKTIDNDLWGTEMTFGFQSAVDIATPCDATLSIGKWLQDARNCGATVSEKDYYEENARCILTVWGQQDTQLNDYANRGWGGLTRSFYRERWKRFTDGVIAAVSEDKPFDEDKFHQDITQFEYNWTLQKDSFPIVSEEDPIQIADSLILKYDTYFTKAQ